MHDHDGNGWKWPQRRFQIAAISWIWGVEIDTQTAPLTVTLTNSGGPLAIGGITFTGANPAISARPNNCARAFHPIARARLMLYSIPRASWRLATMQIADSDPTSPQTVNLGGTGSS